jgi:murein DD-endopeptidase MepM/ murein hydrolase activator NlpD
MSEVLIYIGKVLIIQGVLYGLYRLALRQSLRHAWNRFYLLAALLLSFAIPFIEMPAQVELEPIDTEYVITWVQESTLEYDLVPSGEQTTSSFSVWVIVPWLYGVIVLFLVVRSVLYLFFLQKLKKHAEYVKKHWFKLFKTSQPRPFSFFSNVFMPADLFGSSSFDQILAHECVHVKQRHSIDRLLLDFLVSLFWFNPFIYLYRNALIEIHEYQADEAVIRRFNDPVGYQEILFSQLQTAPYSGLVSHFNFSMIKKRIVMMNKQKNKYAGLLYALTLPVLVSVIFAFSNKEAIEPIENVGHELAELLGPKPIFDVLPSWDEMKPKGQTQNEQQDSNPPSILPLKETEKVRMSSGFGTRFDPIEKVEKLHRGIDLATAIGNPVLATADGKVELAGEDGKHGQRVIIKHGDVYTTAYSHLSTVEVKVGQLVKKGDQLGLSGNSGASTAPHLHYEVQKDEDFVNPIYYITDYNFKVKTEGDKVEKQMKQSLLKSEREKAEAEMVIAREEEERARAEEMKAERALSLAERERERTEQMQIEEQKRMKEEKLLKEKEKNKNKKKNKSDKKDKSNQTAFKVIIDPGHGGKDHGAILENNINEKEEMLQLAIEISSRLKEAYHLDVVLTRNDDAFMSLKDRVNASKNATLLVSLHVDDLSGASGVLPVFQNDGQFPEESKMIAEKMRSELIKEGRNSKIGFTSGNNSHYLLREAFCPSIMLNISEDELGNQRDLIANHISEAIYASL